MQPPHALHQRRHRVAQHQHLGLELVQALDVDALRAADEDAVLDFFELGFEHVDDRKIAVDDGVHQRIEHERRAQCQQVRLALGARAHAEEALRRVQPRRQHVAGADKHVDLADRHFAVFQFDRLHHRKQRVAVLFDLGALVAALGVCDRQFVQAEFVLHDQQIFRRRIAQRDPHERVKPFEVIADFTDADVGQFFAFLVGDAIDQHGHPIWPEQAPRCQSLLDRRAPSRLARPTRPWRHRSPVRRSCG